MTDMPSRKLAVILHADVVGSTALVQKDERWRQHFSTGLTNIDLVALIPVL